MSEIGEMRERVSIRQFDNTELVTGGVWADVKATGSTPRIQGEDEHARQYDIKIRYLSTVTPAMRVVLDDSRVLKIDSTRDADLRRRFLVLSCTEDNAQ